MLLKQGKFTEEEIRQEYQEFQSTLNVTVEKGRFIELFQGSKFHQALLSSFIVLVGRCVNISPSIR